MALFSRRYLVEDIAFAAGSFCRLACAALGENLDPEFPDQTMAVLWGRRVPSWGHHFFEQRLDAGPEEGFFGGAVRHLTH